MPVRAPVTEPAAGDLRIAPPTAKTLGAKFFLREDHALVRVGSTFGSAPFALEPVALRWLSPHLLFRQGVEREILRLREHLSHVPATRPRLALARP